MVPQINGARCPVSLGALRAEVGRPSSGCRASPVLDQGCGIGMCGSTCGAVSAAAMHPQSFAASEFAQAWSTRCTASPSSRMPLRRSGADARKSPHPRPGMPVLQASPSGSRRERVESLCFLHEPGTPAPASASKAAEPLPGRCRRGLGAWMRRSWPLHRLGPPPASSLNAKT